MEFNKMHHVYFLGIGGIGMSAIARYFHAMGKSVAGYDKTATDLTNDLITEGMTIHFEDDITRIPVAFKEQLATLLVVYTPAIPADNKELNFFRSTGVTIKKRSEVLGMIAANSYTLAIAGTHGKTTTSSMIAHLLKTANKDPSAFLGGITQNYHTNLLLSSTLNVAPETTQKPLLVVEADEYDRSFLTLFPDMAVITSVDADHLDIYENESQVLESYIQFAQQVKNKLIIKNSIASKIQVKSEKLTYSIIDTSADYFAKNIKIANGVYRYDVVTPHAIFENLTLGLPGLHNVENSIAAIALACELAVSEKDIRLALLTFKGVKRRFDYHIKSDKLIFIDDYAHHPAELTATINSVREMYPHKKITGIFQPHLYSRTRDFADDFAKSLDLLDECILLEIYPAREQPIKGVDASLLLKKMKSNNKRICRKDELINTIEKLEIEVLLTMGAGDIDTLVPPLKDALLKRLDTSVASALANN